MSATDFRLNLIGLFLGTGIVSSLVAQEPADPQSRPPSMETLWQQAERALLAGDPSTAIAAADAMTEHYSSNVGAIRRAGDIYLRTGKVTQAADCFDRYVDAQPAQMPYLWQRGIALYFAGEFARGARQFERHREVNPHDVENAAWHFLCVAKSDSLAKARQMLLPAPRDPRIPMEEVLEMLASGDTDAVNRKIDSLPKDSRARADARFYGDFYLGLYADARGDRDQALRLLSRAAKDAPRHYMGDVARVYARHLAK